MRSTAESRIRWTIGAVGLLAALLLAGPGSEQGRGDRPRRGRDRVAARDLPSLQPAIEAGFTCFDAIHPTGTYVVSLHLLARETLHDHERESRIRGLLHLLLAGQEGSFGYHGHLPNTKEGPSGAERPAKPAGCEVWCACS